MPEAKNSSDLYCAERYAAWAAELARCQRCLPDGEDQQGESQRDEMGIELTRQSGWSPTRPVGP